MRRMSRSKVPCSSATREFSSWVGILPEYAAARVRCQPKSWRSRLLVFKIRQRVVEIKAEQVRIFADDRRRRYIEDVIVGFLGNLVFVFRQQLPKIPFAGIFRHAADQRQH